jgi:hypothetical protein
MRNGEGRQTGSASRRLIMRMSVRVSDVLGERLSAIRAERQVDLSCLVRQALEAYLDGLSVEAPRSAWVAHTLQLPHSLDECISVVLAHWPAAIRERLAEDASRRSLAQKDLLLGILYSWATRMWTP